jgi:hypothetical protein
MTIFISLRQLEYLESVFLFLKTFLFGDISVGVGPFSSHLQNYQY